VSWEIAADLTAILEGAPAIVRMILAPVGIVGFATDVVSQGKFGLATALSDQKLAIFRAAVQINPNI
jgi:hypothetical protein